MTYELTLMLNVEQDEAIAVARGLARQFDASVVVTDLSRSERHAVITVRPEKDAARPGSHGATRLIREGHTNASN